MQKNFYSLRKETESNHSELKRLEECILRLEAENDLDIGGKDYQELQTAENEILEIQKQIEAEEIALETMSKRKLLWQLNLQTATEKEVQYNLDINNMLFQSRDLEEDISSTTQEIVRCQQHLEKLMQINSLNDSFYIWYLGPYATINNFRLGNTSIKPIEPNEINAALGETALAVYLVANRCQVDLKIYSILPMGSFPKVIKLDDRNKPIFPLYIDQTSWTLFPKRNFNCALAGFMSCIGELGDFVASYDPTMTMPYKINIPDSKIGDVSFVYGVDDEQWTRSLKFMLSNVKWIIAWYTKHGKTLSVTTSATSMI